MTLLEVFRFEKKKEAAFQQFFFKQDLIICRATAILVISIMVLLIAIDYFRVQDFTWVLMARLIVVGVLGTLWFLTYQKYMTAFELQGWLLLINVVFLASVFFMDATSHMPPFYLTNSIVVYMFIACTVSGVRYRYVSVLNILVVVLFLFYAQSSSNSGFHRSQIPNVMISLSVGLLIGFVWERYKRINFLQQTQLNSLINIFSHDMVSPLNSLLNLLSLSDRNLLDKAELDLYIERIKKTTANNVLLLQNLVKWSKSHMQGFSPHVERLEASLLTQESIDLLQNMAGEKNIIIRNHATDNLSWMADLEMTKLVLRNTLSNAIKFSHPNGAIDVRAKKENGFLTLSVKDEGVGMTPEEVGDLFTMKVKSTPGTADERGTGIGMYITREFITLNKGEIKVESTKGKGTTVSISLPEFGGPAPR